MVRFSRVRLAVCPMCHPQVIRSRWLRGYHGGDVLKYQESCEGFKTLPLNWVECGIFLYGGDRADTGFGPRPDFGRPQVRQYINDNALLLLRDYSVDGLRVDDTTDIRIAEG